MELGKNIIVLLVALASAIIVFVLLPSTNFAPYNKNHVYQYAGKYEPFTESAVGSKGNVSSSGSSVIMSTGSSVSPSGSSVIMSTGSSVSPSSSPKTSISPASTSEDSDMLSSAEGFEPAIERLRDLKWGELNDSGILDKFSQVSSTGQDGVNGCISSGLSNTNGYLCLTPELIDLLSTRGGNATGRDSQIGAPPTK